MQSPDAPSHRLGEVPLFARVDPGILDELAALSRLRRYPQGQVLFNEGDPGDSLIVVEEGQLRVSRISAAGEEVVLSVIEPPAALGELALLDGQPRDATVTAQRPVAVRHIPRQVFLDALQRDAALLDGLLKSLAELVRAGNARHADTLGLDVHGRLARWLLKRAQTLRLSTGREVQGLTMHRSQGELAAELGTTRSTLNRALREFEDLGFIVVDNDNVVILQPHALESYLL